MKREAIGMVICFIMLFITIICLFIGGTVLLIQIFAIPAYIAFIIFAAIYLGGCLLAFSVLTADTSTSK